MHLEASYICSASQSLCYSMVVDMNLFHQNYRSIYSLTLETGGMCTPPETSSAATLGLLVAPRSWQRVRTVRFPGTLQGCILSSQDRRALHPAPNLLQRALETRCRTALPIVCIGEHLVTCYYISRFWHLSILLSRL